MTNLFNTSELSTKNVANATLSEMKTIFKTLLKDLSKLSISNYNFNNKDYSFQNEPYVEWKDYEKTVDFEIEKLTEKEIRKQFKEIFTHSLSSILIYNNSIGYINLPYYYADKDLIQKEILSKFASQQDFSLVRNLELLLDIMFDNYGLITNKGFQLNNKIEIVFILNSQVNTYEYAKKRITQTIQKNTQNYPLLEKLITNVSDDDELFQSIKNLPPCFITKNFILKYIDHIDQNFTDEEKKSKFSVFFNIIFKNKFLLNEVNSNMKILHKINKLVQNNETLFSELIIKIPGLSIVFNKFEFGQQTLVEIPFSKVFNYDLPKMIKELAVNKNNQTLVKEVLNSCFKNFIKLMSEEKNDIKIKSVPTEGRSVDIIFYSKNAELVNHNYAKFNRFFTHCCVELFVNNVAGIDKQKTYKEKIKTIDLYLEKEIVKFDLEEIIPINDNNKNNKLKF